MNKEQKKLVKQIRDIRDDLDWLLSDFPDLPDVAQHRIGIAATQIGVIAVAVTNLLDPPKSTADEPHIPGAFRTKFIPGVLGEVFRPKPTTDKSIPQL